MQFALPLTALFHPQTNNSNTNCGHEKFKIQKVTETALISYS